MKTNLGRPDPLAGLSKTIDVAKQHSLSMPQARSRAENVAKAMAAQYGIAWNWDGNAIRFRGSGTTAGVSGRLALDEKRVQIVIVLPLLLTAFAERIRAEIERYLQPFA